MYDQNLSWMGAHLRQPMKTAG